MERLEDSLRSRKTNLFSDTSEAVRLPYRPMHGKGFVGPKSTFGRASQSNSNALRTKTSRKPSACRRLDPSPSRDEYSEDELHLGPQDSKAGDEGHASLGEGPKESHGDGVMVNGKYLKYHPSFQPPKKPLPNFKKKVVDGGSPAGSQSSQGSVSSTKATVSRASAPRSPSQCRAASPVQATATTAKHATKARSRNSPLNELDSNNSRGSSGILEIDPETEPEPRHKTPRLSPSLRPKPRPAYMGSGRSKQAEDTIGIPFRDTDGEGDARRLRRRKVGVSEDENQSRGPRPAEKAKQKGKSKAREPMNPIDRLSPVQHSYDDEPPQRPTKDGARKKTRKLAEYPEPPPLSSPSSPPRAKKSRQPEDFPMDLVSPLSSQKSPLSRQASQLRDFPQLPPLSSSPDDGDRSRSRRGKSKTSQASSQRSHVHKNTVFSSAESDGCSEDEQADLKPFPMQTQLLESIGRSPPKRLDGHSSDLEDERARRARKKRRADADPNERLADILRDGDGPEFDDDDMVLLGREVDPHTLCPWCDERLPATPSPHLQSLIETARNNSIRNPRPTNPLGLRASVGMFVSVCQRHRFESHQVPKAQAHGWPTTIDWERVPLRIRALRARWQAIIDDVDEDFVPSMRRGHSGDSDWEDRPRKSSVFWQDVVRNVRKDGSRKIAGVAGQLAHFSKTQPGYYGELGYIIISQTMYDMFPPPSFPPDSTLPLSPADFIQLILIPEAAVALIMEDMHQTRDEAIVTLRDSAEYGVAMFPDDQSEDVQCEQIVRRRAETRRRELEAEERVEEMLLSEASQDTEAEDSRPKPRRRVRAGTAQAEAESEKSEVESVPTPLPRTRKAKAKARSCQTRESTDVEVSDAPSLPRGVRDLRDTGRVTRPRSRAPTPAAPSSDIEMDAQPVPVPRPRPRRKQPDMRPAAIHRDDGQEPYRPSTPDFTQRARSDHDDDTPMRPTIWAKNLVDEDPTPRPKKAPRFPLQMARERRDKRVASGQRDGDRSDGMTEDGYSTSSSRRGTGRTRYRSPMADKSSWLLSDPDD